MPIDVQIELGVGLGLGSMGLFITLNLRSQPRQREKVAFLFRQADVQDYAMTIRCLRCNHRLLQLGLAHKLFCR